MGFTSAEKRRDRRIDRRFDNAAAAAYAEVRAATRDRRSDALDKLIASHAIGLNLTLVTNNLEDFRSYPNIALENWVDSPP